MSGDPVWVNGSLTGTIDPRDRGLTLGDGVFDTLVAFNRKPFAGDRHMARLIEHTGAIGIALDANMVRSGWDAVLGAAKGEHIILRTTVTRGVTARGLWTASQAEPTIIVSATPWSGSAMGRPVRLITSAIRRNASSPVSRIKSTGYLDNILTAREAAERGVDDALLLNGDGKVACSTIANVFVISGDELVTPQVADGLMAGIVRGLIIEAAESLRLVAAERSLEVVELFAADGVFLTNSVRLVAPVQSLDGRPVGGRAEHRIAEVLASLAGRIRAEHGFDPRGT